MKELIDKLSLGIIEYESLEAVSDITELLISVQAKELYTGSFHIISTTGEEIKGIVYSTDERLIIDTATFLSEKALINYSVDARLIDENTSFNGFINIVSNGGEFVIPFTVKIENTKIKLGTLELKNLFHFANLVQIDYDEAKKIFFKDEFKRIIQLENENYIPLYEGLKESSNKDLAIEEFLVAVNKKNRVKVRLSETSKEYSGITEDYGDYITLSKDGWGYTEIRIENKSEFIKIPKNSITSQDFAGSNYELSYIIEKDKLHSGTNYGMLSFVTPYKSIDLVLKVNTVKNEKNDYKKYIFSLFKIYLEFRMKKRDLNSWSNESLRILDRAVFETEDNMKNTIFLKLLKAQILVMIGKDSEGSFILETVAGDLIENKNVYEELYAYYLYIRTLEKRDDYFTKEIIVKIKEYFERKNEAWQILWVLFYLDDNFDNNKSLKIIRIKESYNMGMRSPIMYYEAVLELNSAPNLLRVCDDFEEQIINFGVKYEFVNKQLAIRFSETAADLKKFKYRVYKNLSKLYEKYREDSILENLLSYIIKANKSSKEYLKWYKLGIEKNIKLTGIYEYYMYSEVEFEEKIPQILLMYFAYKNESISSEKLDSLYRYILENKESESNIYKIYLPKIEKHVSMSLMEGRINRDLSYLYKEMLTKSMINTDLSTKLPGILCTYEIKLEDNKYVSIEVIHKEITEKVKYNIVDKKAYIRMYSEDAAIIFYDSRGRKFASNKNYSLEKLLDLDEYMRLCYEMYKDEDEITDLGLYIYFADKYLKYKKNPEKSIFILKKLSDSKIIRECYQALIYDRIVEYYSDNYDGDMLDDFITHVDMENLRSAARIKIIELSVLRGLWEKAYEMILRYGFSGMDSRKILKLATKIIHKREEFLTDMYQEDALLSNLCISSFRKGKYNDETLNYLSKFFNGSTKEMLDIWMAANEYEFESRELEEKLIAQMLFSKAYISNMDMVYSSYYKRGASRKVKKAYLVSKAYDYYVREVVIDERIFIYIEKELLENDDLNDLTSIAYLKYLSTLDTLKEVQLELARSIIFEMVKKNKIFEFYKKFSKYFKIPYVIADKTIIEYRTRPDRKVTIHYMLEDKSNTIDSYSVAEMKNICYGIYTFSFVVFYGECLKYYITEEKDDEKQIVHSCSLKGNDGVLTSENIHYSMINDMMVCIEMHEEKTLGKIANDYFVEKSLVDRIFKRV